MNNNDLPYIIKKMEHCYRSLTPFSQKEIYLILRWRQMGMTMKSIAHRISCRRKDLGDCNEVIYRLMEAEYEN